MTVHVSPGCFLILALFVIHPLAGRASDGHPYKHVHLIRNAALRSFCDTLPDSRKVTEEPGNKSKPDMVKEVPKSRKQIKPIAIPAITPAKPIQIIKPKILKPNIRIF
jgi:hypothetical protein